jgi:hypothetical protein
MNVMPTRILLLRSGGLLILPLFPFPDNDMKRDGGLGIVNANEEQQRRSGDQEKGRVRMRASRAC